jgi:hypothetical protein
MFSNLVDVHGVYCRISEVRLLLTNEDSHLVGSFISSVQGKETHKIKPHTLQHHQYFCYYNAAATDQIDRLLLGSFLLTFAGHHTS